MTAAAPGTVEVDFSSLHHVYEPHKAGIPRRIDVYFRDLWARREFAAEMSKANMRSANTRTFFGQAWLVLNPLLLAAVYYLLVSVLSHSNKTGWAYFSHLTGGLFAFYYVSGCMTTGAASVIGGGKLLLNTAFPRLLMPLSAVRTAFFRFLPTIPVYFVFHILAHNPWTWKTALSAVFLVLMTAFGAGMAAIFATLQVYFRDTASFLPYFVRIWLYISPVLWVVDASKSNHVFKLLAPFNPLYPLLGGYGELLQESHMPSFHMWLAAVLWAVVSVVVGFGYFMSRERDFAVRI